MASHTFRVGVNGPECARTTGVKGKEKKKKEVEMFLVPTKPQRPEPCLPGSHLAKPKAKGQGPTAASLISLEGRCVHYTWDKICYTLFTNVQLKVCSGHCCPISRATPSSVGRTHSLSALEC